MVSTDHPSDPAAIAPADRTWIPGAGRLGAALLVYFAFQIGLRVFISPALELDEAEQMVLTQKWSWGYFSQPPLYTWLQILFFKTFGLSVFALALLKNILLFGVYWLTYLNARKVVRHPLGALAAAASVFFFPEIAYQSQIDRTHSVLALVLVSATLYFFLKMAEDRRWRHFVLFGLCAGLGLLSKYNVAFFLIGLALAALLVPEYRPVILNRRMLAAAAVALAVFLPNGLWMLRHPELALLTSSKFHVAAGAPFLNLPGLTRLASVAVTILAPVFLLHAVVFLRATPATGQVKCRPPAFRLFWRMGIVVLGLAMAAVLVFHVTEVRERWLQPVLLFAPILSILYSEDRLNATRLKWILGLAAVIMVTVSATIIVRVVLADKVARVQRLNLPFDQLASALDPSLAGITLVITDTTLTGGNLRRQRPGKTYSTPALAPLFAPEQKRFAVVWDATQKDLPPAPIPAFLRAAGVSVSGPEARSYFSAPRRFQPGREMRLGVVIVEKSGSPTDPKMR